MSHRFGEKQQRKLVRKLAREVYTDTFSRQAERDAKMEIMKKAVKPRPAWLPQFLWSRIVNRVLRSPDEILYKKQ